MVFLNFSNVFMPAICEFAAANRMQAVRPIQRDAQITFMAGTAFNGSFKVTCTQIVVLLSTVVATTVTGMGLGCEKLYKRNRDKIVLQSF